MHLKRRQVLAGFVATSAMLLAAPVRATPNPVRTTMDPEPLQRFPGFAEGFYRAGEHVYYIDEQQMGWAPSTLDRARLAPIALGSADLSVVLGLLRKRHWAWAVEHAVLRRLHTEPALATELLTAAIAIDRATPRPSAARLHHLKLALDERSRRRPWRSTTTDGRAFATALNA